MILSILFTQTQTLKLKIFIGMSAKLIANGHVQIYKYTEYGQCFDILIVLLKESSYSCFLFLEEGKCYV